jgi:hypothetical protein
MVKKGNNKLDVITFSKLYDKFGEKAAKETLDDVNSGKISSKTIDTYLFKDETKEEYTKRLQDEYKVLREKPHKKKNKIGNLQNQEDDYDYNYVRTMDNNDNDITNGIAGLITLGLFIVGAGMELYRSVKEKRIKKQKSKK